MWNQMKKFVGLGEDEYEIDYQQNQQPITSIEEKKEDNNRRSKRQYRQERNHSSNSNIIGLNTQVSSNEFVIAEPQSFDDAVSIVESLLNRQAIIINLTRLDSNQAQRLIDFVSGATYALDGNQEKVGDGIFLFTPSNVVINALQTTDQAWLNKDVKDLFWKIK